ncbi:metallophosphoesterase [Microbacterium sp. NPDC058389]|uniref:metallophosphoesterase family protein n=1 Tax=Microbacterium sp. NPDC058389 TaxID=3346475 RepID=UPI003658AEEC
MSVLETAATFALPDTQVWMVGDWHGNTGWLQTLLPAMRQHDPSIATILQLGDFGFDITAPGLAAVDYWAGRAGIHRILVTLGNHEPWGKIATAQAEARGKAIRVSEVVWLLPRPFRFMLGGREVLSLGGAASVDKRWRTPGKDWFEDELITDEMVDQAIAGGSAHVMLTHEPGSTVVPEVESVLVRNLHGFPEDALVESAASRRRVERVWEAVQPRLLMHGHMHVYGDRVFADGRKIISLNRDVMAGNAGVLDMETLSFEPLPLVSIRGWS